MFADSIRGFVRCVVLLKSIDVGIIELLLGNRNEFLTNDLCLNSTDSDHEFTSNLQVVNKI